MFLRHGCLGRVRIDLCIYYTRPFNLFGQSKKFYSIDFSRQIAFPCPHKSALSIVERRNEKADLKGRKKAYWFAHTNCSKKCTMRREQRQRKCTDRQANADWPTRPSYTYANDAHASRPYTPQGQANNFGQKTERAFEYRKTRRGASA